MIERALQRGGDLLFAGDAWGGLGRVLLFLAIAWGFFVPLMSWVERRVSAYLQDRCGPNRVGPWGLLQIVADGIKFLMKEDVVPSGAQRTLFVAAPVLAVAVAMLAVAVIPFGFRLGPRGGEALVIADLDAGLLYLLAISSLSVYALLLGGWAANNKYSLLGAVRAGAQMVSYEIPMALAALSVMLLAGSPRLTDIVAAQQSLWWILPGFLAFLLYLPAAFAETNRTPFDLPEGESEIVGYHVEYSSMKFAMFFMAEYANMVTQSAVITCLFFGGYQLLPGLSWQRLGLDLAVWWPLTVLWFWAKVAFLMVFYVWVRWTLPRFRYDQLMQLSWRRLLPLGLLNLVLLAALLYFRRG